jgi:enolase-phosphatase E1
MIWATGYTRGEIEGHVYPDSPHALRAWREMGLPLYVYSSGSVEAQKLLFGHTRAGDLTPLFSGYFDTRIGGKLEAGSYRRIAAEIGVAPERVLFLSDHAGEIAAAAGAGWQTQLVDRDGKAAGSVNSLEAISVERAA